MKVVGSSVCLPQGTRPPAKGIGGGGSYSILRFLRVYFPRAKVAITFKGTSQYSLPHKGPLVFLQPGQLHSWSAWYKGHSKWKVWTVPPVPGYKIKPIPKLKEGVLKPVMSE